MKNTRKLLAAVMALTMVSAIAPMSAFAVDDTVIKQDSTTKSGTMTATYDVTAKYTVTIPAGVTLDSTNAVSKNIEANDVMLESGKKITVKLTGASNTASGASFSAKTTKGDSTATYTIGKGEATTGISVGDTVAEFTADGTQALTFSKAEGATYAGAHTETLTFGIAVEDAIQSETISLIKEQNPDNPEIVTSVTSEHFKVTTGYSDIGAFGLAVNKFGAMTIESLNGENITKIELSYAWGSNANTVSVTPGTLNDAYNTISDINATKVTVSSSSTAGVKFGSVKIYYR